MFCKIGPWVLAATVVIAGCGGPTMKLNELVEGTATLEGTPLAYVRVEFFPQSPPGLRPPGSSAMTDEQGHFRLTCENQMPGAIIGKHRVIVMQPRTEERSADPRAQPQEAAPLPKSAKKNPPIPAAYIIASKSPLDIEVTPDQHTYDLNLKKNP
jgi:hypothetical protein